VWGDPHLVTFDGLAYDLQTAGEHLLVESDDGSVVLQTRHEPWGTSDRVSVVTAVALELTGLAVEIDADGTLTVDGQVATLANGDWIPLLDSAAISRDGNTYSIGWPGDSDERFRLDVKYGSDHLNLTPYLPPSLMGSVSGLLGDGDGDPSNDLATSDGTVLEQPISSSTLYGTYADSWRITQQESLFTYEQGESTGTFTDLEFPSGV
jgi:hypothetical protein